LAHTLNLKAVQRLSDHCRAKIDSRRGLRFDQKSNSGRFGTKDPVLLQVSRL